MNARAAGLQKVANAICDCHGSSKRTSSINNSRQSSILEKNIDTEDDDYANEFFDYDERIELGRT